MKRRISLGERARGSANEEKVCDTAVPSWFSIAVSSGEPVGPHNHRWGEFVYASSGMTQAALGGVQFLALLNHGIWIPPNTDHHHPTRCDTSCYVLSVALPSCVPFPPTTMAIAVSPLMKVMLKHLASDSCLDDRSIQYGRFVRVFLDLFASAPAAETYLPWSTDKQLEPILSHLRDHPADNRTLAEHAHEAGVGERTLIRRCAKDLGMTFAEWKQRVRIVQAVSLLEAGGTVDGSSRNARLQQRIIVHCNVQADGGIDARCLSAIEWLT